MSCTMCNHILSNVHVMSRNKTLSCILSYFYSKYIPPDIFHALTYHKQLHLTYHCNHWNVKNWNNFTSHSSWLLSPLWLSLEAPPSLGLLLLFLNLTKNPPFCSGRWRGLGAIRRESRIPKRKKNHELIKLVARRRSFGIPFFFIFAPIGATLSILVAKKKSIFTFHVMSSIVTRSSIFFFVQNDRPEPSPPP